MYEFLLQHLGPPTFPIDIREWAVIIFACPQVSFVRGVAPEMIDINIPELIAAPQLPQNPQAPSGTLFPLAIISLSEESRLMFPPALWYAVSRAAPTRV